MGNQSLLPLLCRRQLKLPTKWTGEERPSCALPLGACSVVHFKGAWEDDESLHLVMEYCRGGELIHQVGRRAYSEEMVSRGGMGLAGGE